MKTSRTELIALTAMPLAGYFMIRDDVVGVILVLAWTIILAIFTRL